MVSNVLKINCPVRYRAQIPSAPHLGFAPTPKPGRFISPGKQSNNKAPNQRIVSTDRSIKRLLYWIQHLDQYTSRMQVILRPDIEPE